MEREAIELIQESAHIPEIIEAIQSQETLVPVAIVPESMSVKSLESYMEFKSFYSKSFSTASIDDFIRYCAVYDRANAECFVDNYDHYAAWPYGAANRVSIFLLTFNNEGEGL